MADALDRMIADMELNFPRELAINLILRDWLISAGYLPPNEFDEGTPTEGEA